MNKRFRYQGYSESGQAAFGEVAAKSHEAALEKAYRHAKHIVSVNELTEKKGIFNSAAKKVPLRVDMQQISTMLAAGMPLAQAVDTIAHQERSHARTKAGWLNVSEQLAAGAPTHAAIEGLTDKLPNYIVPLIKSGEATGDLSGSFAAIHQQLEQAEEFSNQVKSAMIYPLILLSVGFAVAVLMIMAVIPNFTWLLDHQDELPTLSYWVIAGGNALRESPAGLLYLAIFATFSALLLRIPTVRAGAMTLINQLPVIGPWRENADYTRWLTIMATLLERKVSLAESLKISESSCGPQLALAVQAIRNDISAGKPLAEAVSSRTQVPVMVTNLIATGERAGALESIFKSLASDYKVTWEQQTERLLKLLEPLAIVLIGGLLGTMMIGILLGITSATSIGI